MLLMFSDICLNTSSYLAEFEARVFQVIINRLLIKWIITYPGPENEVQCSGEDKKRHRFVISFPFSSDVFPEKLPRVDNQKPDCQQQGAFKGKGQAQEIIYCLCEIDSSSTDRLSAAGTIISLNCKSTIQTVFIVIS